MKTLINLTATLCLILGYGSLSQAQQADNADTKYGPVLKVKPKGIVATDQQPKASSQVAKPGEGEEINGGLNRDIIRRIHHPKPQPAPKPKP